MNVSKSVIFSILMATVLSMTLSGVFFLPVQAQEEFVRIAVVGDIDCKSSQTKQFDMIVKFKADLFFSGGDYGYSNGQCVLDNIKAHGFDKEKNNVAISCGNHDSCSQLRGFLGMSKNYGSKFFSDAKIAAHIFDGNTGFGTGSTQYTAMKKELESSDAWYNFVLIHQPFATAKSNHGPNGGFDTWQPIFKNNGVNMVLQAHNHNDQRFNIEDIAYTVNGGGYHDTGSALYDINSNSFKTFPLLFGDDTHNAVLFLDVQVNDPNVKKIKGQLIGADEKVLDTFTVEGVPEPPKEICGNGIDDNGDGQIDEDCPVIPPPPTGNESQVKVLDVTASTFQAPNAPNNTIDGSLDTRWSADGDPQIISYQFNDTWKVNKVAVAFYKGDTRTASFEINGQQFVSSGATNALQNFTLSNATAGMNSSSMTITGHGNSDNTWNSYTEVKFYGILAANATAPPPEPPPECPVGTVWDPITQTCEELPPPPEPPGNATHFNVTIGAGIAQFIPDDKSLPILETEVTNGTAVLPKP